ncbi:RND family transporter [bacterium]|nr:RND family transporter [bacterium]
MKNLSDKIILYRWPIIVGFVLITIVLSIQIPRTEIDTDMKSQLPANMTSRLNTDKIDELFGGTEMLMVLVQTDDILNPGTLRKVRKIAKKVNRVEGVDKVMSLFDLKSIKGESGAMIVDPAVKRIPKNNKEKELLRQEIRLNDIVYGNVVSKDFTVTSVIAMLKDDVSDQEVVPAVQSIIDEIEGPENILIGGLPYSRVQMGVKIKQDLKRLMPAAILIMLVFLYVCFRRIRGVILPFLVVIMSILFAMGFIPVFGWKIHIITIILPIFLVAVANDYGIHLIAKYQEYNLPQNKYSRKNIAKLLFQSLSRPVLLTGLTTMAGILCLGSHILVPAKQLGVLAAMGIVFALAASLFFIPAVLSMMPRSRPVFITMDEGHKNKPLLERLLWFFGDVVSKHPKSILIFAMILAVVAGMGIFRVVVDTNPSSYYEKDDPVVVSTNLIDTHLGGSQNISIVYEGDIKDPVLLHKIDRMEKRLESMNEVGNTVSVARVVRQMSRALHDSNEANFDKIPDNRNAVAQYFELYSMSGDPGDFEKMVDFPYKHAVVTARINKTSTIVLNQVVDRMQEILKGDRDVLLIGGFGVVLSDLAHAVVNGQIVSLFLAMMLVSVLLMLLFRSVTAGFVSVIPLALSMLLLFGLMGLFQIELNIATALLSSIMIGVGIDYTIHFLWRYREEYRSGLAYAEAVHKTLLTTGRGIIFNAFSVIVGFSVLLISSFLPVRFFGFLVVVSILACLIGALVLIPALCLVIKPKFLEPTVK